VVGVEVSESPGLFEILEEVLHAISSKCRALVGGGIREVDIEISEEDWGPFVLGEPAKSLLSVWVGP
jgi:hypothetical protein